jgi:hypothetical protein
MKNLRMDLFTDFKCIGSKCPYTCCKGWSVFIDKEAAEYYKKVEGELGEKLKKSIKYEGEKISFIMDKNDRCPFLNDDNLCDIYINLGPENMCNICREFPRISHQYGDIYFLTVYQDCPEVAKMLIEKKEPIKFQFAESDKIKAEIKEDIDWKKFNNYINAFVTVEDIVSNQSISIQNRIKLVILFSKQFDELQDDSSNEIQQMLEFFGNEENYKQIIPDLEKIEYLPNKDILFFRQVVEIPMLREDAKHCREFFSDEGISRYKNDIKNNEESASKLHNLQEKLLQVILFKYFMEGFNIDDFKKVFFEGMILYKVYEYSFKNIYFDTGDVFNEERIIERIAKIGRILEHTVDEKKEKRNYKIILEKLKENGIYEYDILLEIT